jgi:retron-type reverse transcriptase
MSDQPKTRQELYDQIRESSRDEVILEEMIRLGYWPRNGEMPNDPADDIRRRNELGGRLRELASESKQLHNVEALKKQMRKERMEESRRKRKERKERILRERAERAEAWRQRKRREIVYLGENVSAGLNHHDGDAAKLRATNLPAAQNIEELALAMDVSVGELRFLAYSRRVSKTTHYRRFAIPKKTGGLRHISAPMPRLKRAQEWILANILEKVELHRAAHGFRRGRSIVTNAQAHVGAELVINIDLKDFFPTVTYPRVKGVFRKLGCSEPIATVLALVCTEPAVDEVELDGALYYVSRGERFLPQGAPSSPALTNILCRGLDARLSGVADKLGFTYTRYADDITFSGPNDAADNIGRALRRIQYIAEQEGFRVHPDKTRVLRKSQRREVTGLVVNEKVAVPRPLLRQFRATLFQIERDGPAGKRWGRSPDVIAAIEGFANFVSMVDAKKGAALGDQVRRIIDRHGRGGARIQIQRNRWQPREEPPSVVTDSGEAPTQATSRPRESQQPTLKKPWWKFW